MDQKLSKAEIDVLSEAMEMWENKDFMDEVMLGLADVFASKDEFDLQERKARRAGQEKERAQKRKNRQERSVLLRAKLIMMKDAIDVENLSNIR
jgi:hypothetical protein